MQRRYVETKVKWKVYECPTNNGPSHWIVTDRAFKGTVLGRFGSEASALEYAYRVNANVSGLGDSVNRALSPA